MLPEKQIQLLYEELGSRIKKSRESKGFSQTEFAHLLKISRASLVNIEKGRQRPPLHNLYEIARLLDISLSELLPSLEVGISDIEEELKLQIETKSAGNLEVKEKLLNFIQHQNSKKSK